ncbi:MAG: DUF5777 family beta-barrel protein [Candidatus Latescibacterota bacterium]
MQLYGERFAYKGLDISSPEDILATAVSRRSGERPELVRIYPGNPDSSLMMITTGAPGIEGSPMPPENTFDAFPPGVEHVIGRHVFQLIATNSQGISVEQYLNGGDPNFWDGDMRIGFSVYRIPGY